MSQDNNSSLLSPLVSALLGDYLNQLTEREVMMIEHKYGRATLAEALDIIRPKPADAFHEALFSYVTDGSAATALYLHLPKLMMYEQLKLKDEWDEEAICLASVGDVPWQILIAWFGNHAQVWQAVDLSPREVVENLQLLIEAGVRLDPYIAKLETLCKCEPGVQKRKLYLCSLEI